MAGIRSSLLFRVGVICKILPSLWCGPRLRLQFEAHTERTPPPSGMRCMHWFWIKIDSLLHRFLAWHL
uniref:Putative secreted protein n=1 Tax=Anopheles darlingi TaxID=43151 RepID=A0A2M4DN11_ANODA